MAKKKKVVPSRKTTTTSKKTRRTSDRPAWIARAYAREEADAANARPFRLLFYGGLVLLGLLALALSLPVGINADEKFQDDYSEKLIDYYTSFGADRAALYEDDQSSQRYNKYYGGVFELFSGAVNAMLGNSPGDPSYSRVRHFLNALFGLLIIVAAAFFAKRLGGYRAGVVALLLLLASPRLLGHSVMNPKDIPFAAGYLLSIYYLFRCLEQMPRPGWRVALGLVLGGALALATRAGGLLVFCYSGLFFGIDFLLRYGLAGIWQQSRELLRYAGFWLVTTALGFGLALLFWPFALQSPIANTLEALKLFSNYSVRITVLFGGESIFSDAVPRSYPYVWLGITLALSVLAGILGALVAIAALVRRFPAVGVGLLLFTGLFPLFYITLQDSPLYDGWRQLLFVYPPLLVAAALFWEYALRRWADPHDGEAKKVAWQPLLVWGLLVLGCADAVLFTARNFSFPYLYFNPIVGGIKGAYGEYETDYWGLSTRQALEWLEDEGVLRAGMTDTVILGTTFPYNVEQQLDPDYRDKVKVQYVRFHRRYAEPWDYGIFPSRFIRGPHLQGGHWPTSKTIHTIDANGVPMSVIERDTAGYAVLAEKALNQNDPATAQEYFAAELALHRDNEQAWTGMASALVSQNMPDPALAALDSALYYAPQNETALYLQGYAYLQKNDSDRAMQSFNHLLRVDPENAMAYYFLGEINRQRNQPREALRLLQEAIRFNPRLKQAYELTAQILESLGDSQNAARYREAASNL